jgi:hypothetical protein
MLLIKRHSVIDLLNLTVLFQMQPHFICPMEPQQGKFTSFFIKRTQIINGYLPYNRSENDFEFAATGDPIMQSARAHINMWVMHMSMHTLYYT